MPAAEGRTLRYAIIGHASTLLAWQAHCLELLAEESVGAVPVAWIDLEAPPPARSALWRLYDAFRLRRRSRALRTVAPGRCYEDLPQLAVTPGPDGELTDADVDAIRGHELDFILRFSGPPLSDAVLGAARYGVWSFRHGLGIPDEPPCFREVERAESVILAAIERLDEPGGDGVPRTIRLHTGCFGITSTSYAHSLDTVLFGAAVWVRRLCHDIHSHDTHTVPLGGSRGEDTGETEWDGDLATRPQTSGKSPGNLRVAVFLGKMFWRLLVHKALSPFIADQWNVGVVDAPIETFLERRPAVRWLPPPPRRDRFVADPFGVVENGRLTVLAEDFDYRTSLGSIVAFERRQDGSWSESRRILKLDVHASYPFLFEWQGRRYCIPETHQAGEVALYEATHFPDEWKKVATLVDFPALDSTLFHDGERWWLFGSRLETAHGFEAWDADMKLYAWWAEDLLGPWQAHPANPLKTDVRSSRPAGTLFRHGDELYRPAQDVSETYGGRVVLNRVTALTPTRFAEEVVRVVEPYEDSPYPHGLHHLSDAGNGVTLVDGKRTIFIWGALAAKLARKFER